ncbi:MAG TPA: hypothetical protein VGL74_11170 [Terriglobales bacterium]|jgi:hypothetical protein
MKKFVRAFLGLAGFGLLAITLTTLTVHRADASGGAPVIVQNTPLPVQGTVSVGNTPSVSVANTPSVTLANTSLAVINPLDNSSKPVPLIISLPQAYESTCSLDVTGSSGGGCGLEAIPAGKKLVIQQINVDANLQGARLIVVSLGIGWNGAPRNPSFPIADNGTDGFGVLHQAVSQHTAIYMDLSSIKAAPTCDVALTGLASAGTVNCLVSGYLVP